jgi:predicted enzyme related to lactoylglutathione lyase
MADNIGKIGWIDMTVDDASGLRDFYQKVVGCNVEDPGGATAALYQP